MQKKMAVACTGWVGLSFLKRAALLFDGFYIDSYDLLDRKEELPWNYAQDYADFEYLRSCNIVFRIPVGHAPKDVFRQAKNELIKTFQATLLSGRDERHYCLAPNVDSDLPQGVTSQYALAANESIARYFGILLSDITGHDVMPILRTPLPQSKDSAAGIVFRVVLDSLPVPDETCSWEDIIGFRQEHADKHWALLRFLHKLSSESITESEIRDEIEWSLNEYKQAMKLHRLKQAQSFVEIFVIPPLELVESLIKFNFSKIAKGAVSISKRRVDLLEAELNAPGRECAYVFDAQERFRRK